MLLFVPGRAYPEACEGNRAYSGASREGNGSGIPPYVILHCYLSPHIRAVFWQMSCPGHFKELPACPVSWLARVLMYLCPEMSPRTNGHEASASLAGVLFTQMSSWPCRRMSASPGTSCVRPFVFYSPLAIFYSICLSQIGCSLICAENRFIGLCWKAGRGNLVGLAPGVGRCLWSSRSAEQQDLGELGRQVTMLRVEFVTKENIHYPYSHIGYVSDAFIWKSWRYSQ